MLLRVVVATSAFAAVACSSAEVKPPAPTKVATPIAAPSTASLLGTLARLTGGATDAASLDSWVGRIDRDPAQLGNYIDEILANDRLAQEIIPSMIFGSFASVRSYYAVPSAFILKQRGPDKPLFLRAPCEGSQAVAVSPWWDLQREIQVCPDAYQPTKWTLAAGEHDFPTEAVLTCDSQVGSPEVETHPVCGCGPNLIRCLPDEAHYNELNRSLMDEVKATVQYVVEQDLPIATLFTSNSTFRDRNAEGYYRRQRIGSLQLADVKAELSGLDSWPTSGAWAPRPEVSPGQHAGLLTAPQVLHSLPDRRQRQRAYYEIMWCNLKNTFGATTEKVLEINASGKNFFSHDSWKQLAHTELCTNCHARLDYGFQFFLGYPDSRASTHYIPALHPTGSGPLYGANIDDLRGSAPLTPINFAQLATTQPEFASCMTQQVVSYVIGDRATDADVKAVSATLASNGTFRSAMKVALTRYAEAWRPKASAASPVVPAPALSHVWKRDGKGMPAPLRAALDRLCTDCHDADRERGVIDLTVETLPRSALVRMADVVAFGTMPKDQVLDPATRDELVTLLIDTLWSDVVGRAEARRYYLGKSRGLSAQQIDTALSMIQKTAGAPSGLEWGVLERGIWSEQSTFTPGFVAVTALEALRSCATASAAGTSGTLDDCLNRTLSVRDLSRQLIHR